MPKPKETIPLKDRDPNAPMGAYKSKKKKKKVKKQKLYMIGRHTYRARSK